MRNIIKITEVLSPSGLLICSLVAPIVFTCEAQNGKDSQWVYEKCMESGDNESPRASCFAPLDSNISCQGIRNPDNCHAALTTHSGASALSQMTLERFAYDLDAKMLCFRPKITANDGYSTFFGYELWIEFVDNSNPVNKTSVRLGAIFWSGVTSREAPGSTLGCVETPAHISYRNASFFISAAQSLPMSLQKNITEQEKAYSLADLKTISLFDGTYQRDHVNKSLPIFALGCKPEVFPPEKEDLQFWITVVVAVGLISVFVVSVIAFLMYRYFYRENTASPSENGRKETISIEV